MNKTCKTCTRHLVMVAYQRSFWFFLFREPLKFAMRAWIWAADIDLAEYRFAIPVCHNCNRFYKNALKDKSPLFCRLNNLINPIFDRFIEKMVGSHAIVDAARLALTRDEAAEPSNVKRWRSI